MGLLCHLSLFLCTLSLGHSQSIDLGSVLTTASTELAAAAEKCTADSAQWLPWSEWSACTDTCGSCGMHMRTRTCLTTVQDCSCTGESTMIEFCNLDVCRYPRVSCCNNFRATSVGGSFACLDFSSQTKSPLLG